MNLIEMRQNLMTVAISDNDFHPAENTLLKVLKEMFYARETDYTTIRPFTPLERYETKDLLNRYVHLENIISIAIVDGVLHQKEMEKCLEIAIRMGFHKEEVIPILDCAQGMLLRNESPERIKNGINEAICTLIAHSN
jgi:tellurite resistance protein